MAQTEHRFNEATVVLLAAASRTSPHLLQRVRIRHRRYNWLGAPWYPASEGGGAMTIGHIVHVTPRHDPATLGEDRERWLAWLLLMAHEAGHVRQAERFGYHGWGRTRFALWAAVNYAGSFLRHGRRAHAKALFEIEAEQGRMRLRAALERTGGCHPKHPVVALAMRNDAASMHAWVRSNLALDRDP